MPPIFWPTGESCVPLTECPCEWEDSSFPPGTTIVQNCQNWLVNLNVFKPIFLNSLTFFAIIIGIEDWEVSSHVQLLWKWCVAVCRRGLPSSLSSLSGIRVWLCWGSLHPHPMGVRQWGWLRRWLGWNLPLYLLPRPVPLYQHAKVNPNSLWLNNSEKLSNLTPTTGTKM